MLGARVTLGSISQYGTQVVAGTNTYLTMTVLGAANLAPGTPTEIQAVVFTPLGANPTPQLSKYQIVGPFVAVPGELTAAAPSTSSAAAAAPLMAAPFSCAAPGTPGGVACAKSASPEARAAAMFAVSRLNAQSALPDGPVGLVEVTKVGEQVVAGTNYYLEMRVRDAKGATKAVQAVVFRALPVNGGGFQLTGYLPM